MNDLVCADCGRQCWSRRSLGSHRARKHGWRGKGAQLRAAAVAVVSWWDALDSKKSGSATETILATQEMDRRVNALRATLDL